MKGRPLNISFANILETKNNLWTIIEQKVFKNLSVLRWNQEKKALVRVFRLQRNTLLLLYCFFFTFLIIINYYYSFFFSLPILCRRFLGDGWIDLLQIFRDYALVSEVCTALSIFRKSLPVGSYLPFIKIQRTSLSAMALTNS